MQVFVCNICGATNQVAEFRSEPATCACGSNVRLRALVHMLSMEIFGQNVLLPDFPKLKSIRGLGMSDHAGYAARLAETFDYTNTYYDREPRFDFTERHPELYGTFDFILSADVVEHIAPPVERAFDEVFKLLKPHGIFCLTVFCAPSDVLREHFPELHQFRIVPLGDQFVLVNRRQDGSIEIREDLVFHSGAGATLEMREFGSTGLEQKLKSCGFREVGFLTENVPGIGILFDSDTSQPLVARKDPFVFDKATISDALDERHRQLDHWFGLSQRLRAELEAARNSRWIKLGEILGIGPRFRPPE